MLFCADPWVFQKPRWAITRVCAEVLAIINIIANKHITFFILSFPLIVSYIRADSLVSRILHYFYLILWNSKPIVLGSGKITNAGFFHVRKFIKTISGFSG